MKADIAIPVASIDCGVAADGVVLTVSCCTVLSAVLSQRPKISCHRGVAADGAQLHNAFSDLGQEACDPLRVIDRGTIADRSVAGDGDMLRNALSHPGQEAHVGPMPQTLIVA
mgnify:CR=1 FL=1